MPPLHSFKRKETEFVDRLAVRLRNLGGAIAAFFRRTAQRGKQRFTVMFIPHSEKRIFNVQISVFTLLFFVFLSAVLVIAFIGFSTHFTTTNRELGNVRTSLERRDTSLDQMQDEIGILWRYFREYQQDMDRVLSLADPNYASVDRNAIGGEIAPLHQPVERDDSGERNVLQLTTIRNYFRTVRDPLGDLEQALSRVRTLIQQIPSGWPIEGGHGSVTAPFGPAHNPFVSGTWYLHKGIDIAWTPGSDILATADGEVVQVEPNINVQYGKNVIIRHQYGYQTRYAHMSAIYVRAGQKVRRGDAIGALGDTGLSLGYHLHYEVIIAGQVVDPQSYLELRGYDMGVREDGTLNGR